jgi:hypothetical protein
MARIIACLSLSMALVVPAGSGQAAADGDRIFGLTKVHQIKVQLSLVEWNALQTSAPRGGTGARGTNYSQPDGRLIHIGGGFGGFFPWAHADIRIGDLELKNVGLRYKGNLSFMQSSAAAPLRASFKLKVDAYGARGSWDGEKTLNFAAGAVDTSGMREAIAFALFRAAGVPAPRTAYAELVFTVPGLYENTSAGLFTIIEEVNKSFLKRALPPGTGLLFKPEGLRGGIQSLGDSWASYVTALRPERDATPQEQQRVMEFGRLVSQTDVALFRSKIGAYLDVDQFLRYLAVNALIENWDSYLGGGHNFYLYLDPADGKFRFIPWDQDLSMAARGMGLGQTSDILKPYRSDQPLIHWLMDDPAVMAQYRAIVRELAANVFTHTALMNMVDSLEKVVVGRAPSPRAYLEGRVTYLQQLVAGWGGK